MTRTFHEKIHCEICGHQQTAQTDFEKWFRDNPDLESKSGIVRFDLDLLLHKYKTVVDGKGSRDIQCMMFIEVKTFMATPSPAQVDTFSILNQLLRNRKPNLHSKPRRQAEGSVTKAYSKILKRDVRIKLYGAHLLQLDGTHPLNSSFMQWDWKPIDLNRLIELLTFERDPDRIHLRTDFRRRSRPWNQMPLLFDVENQRAASGNGTSKD